MAQCDCTVNAHAHSRHVKGVSFHKIQSVSSQTVTDISGKNSQLRFSLREQILLKRVRYC